MPLTSCIARGARTGADVGAERHDVESIRRDGRPALPDRRQAGAIDTFLRGTCGPGYRAALDRYFRAHSTNMWPTRLRSSNRSCRRCSSGRSGRRTPSASFNRSWPLWGAESGDGSDLGRAQQLLLDWLPNVEPFVLPDATHLLQVENPRGMAEGLAAFFARHPLTVPA